MPDSGIRSEVIKVAQAQVHVASIKSSNDIVGCFAVDEAELEKDDSIKANIRETWVKAQSAIYEKEKKKECEKGSSVSAILLFIDANKTIYCSNVGNSSAYLIMKDKIGGVVTITRLSNRHATIDMAANYDSKCIITGISIHEHVIHERLPNPSLETSVLVTSDALTRDQMEGIAFKSFLAKEIANTDAETNHAINIATYLKNQNPNQSAVAFVTLPPEVQKPIVIGFCHGKAPSMRAARGTATTFMEQMGKSKPFVMAFDTAFDTVILAKIPTRNKRMSRSHKSHRETMVLSEFECASKGDKNRLVENLGACGVVAVAIDTKEMKGNIVRVVNQGKLLERIFDAQDAMDSQAVGKHSARFAKGRLDNNRGSGRY